MTAAELSQHLTDTFPGVDVLVANGDSYFYYDPDRVRRHDRTHPFATLVTSDAHDQCSDLNRPGVFRLNVGVGKERFLELFGGPFNEKTDAARYDFTALDRLLPHTVYGKMYWASVLNPGDATLPTVKQLLAEAYARAAGNRANV